jgi:hypothetical protein
MDRTKKTLQTSEMSILRPFKMDILITRIHPNVYQRVL